MSDLFPVGFKSAFSIGEGVIFPEQLALKMKSLGFDYLPITDSNSMGGLISAIDAAKRLDLRLLYGIEIFFSDSFKIIFYPDDKTGFRWLNKFLSAKIVIIQNFSHNKKTNSAYLIDMLLQNLQEIQGYGRAIVSLKTPIEAIKILHQSNWELYAGIEPRAAVADWQNFQQVSRNFKIKDIAELILNAVQPEDAIKLRLIKAVKNNLLFNDVEPIEAIFPSKKLYDKSHFGGNLASIKNSFEFVSQPTYIPSTDKFFMPDFYNNKEMAEKTLYELSLDGLKAKFKQLTPIVLSRFEKEFNLIKEMGLVDYFLVVHDITRKSNELGHRVLGRGSAANSLISYALDFTQIDPIKHDLYFERFLNKGRKSPPDIDLDFSWKVRDQIYDYLKAKWGKDKVALISTHTTFRGRGAVRETAKTLGIPEYELSKITSAIGFRSLSDFRETFKSRPELDPNDFKRPEIKNLLRMSLSIEGLIAHSSLHAGGLVIAPETIFDFCATSPSSKVLNATQYEMRAIEKAGLVKLDILSQRALGVYSDVTQALLNKGEDLSPIMLPENLEDDRTTSELLKNGQTMGVFYIESPGMRNLLRKLSCSTFKGLVAASSIIRPGVAESGMMQEYIKRHRKEAKWTSLSPQMDEILADTHGVMVYQEDVMKVAARIAGFSLTKADYLRRAMSGKERSQENMIAVENDFISGAMKNGLSKKVASEIWRQVKSFCGYAFCKAHSASYAILSMQLLWLKSRFPALYMSATINNRGGFYGTQAYISESSRLGLKLYPPAINTSDDGFSPFKDGIITGLSFIGDLKTSTIEKILRERKILKFESLSDFLFRIRPDSSEYENLIKSGALSEFGSPAQCRWHRKIMPEGSLIITEQKIPDKFCVYPSRKEIIKSELESLGFAISGHPVELFDKPLNCISSDLIAKNIGKKVSTVGLLVAAKSVTTSKGDRMKFLTFEDEKGLTEITFFPGAWKRNARLLGKGGVFLISGKVDNEFGAISIIGDRLTGM